MSNKMKLYILHPPKIIRIRRPDYRQPPHRSSRMQKILRLLVLFNFLQVVLLQMSDTVTPDVKKKTEKTHTFSYVCEVCFRNSSSQTRSYSLAKQNTCKASFSILPCYKIHVFFNVLNRGEIQPVLNLFSSILNMLKY